MVAALGARAAMKPIKPVLHTLSLITFDDIETIEHDTVEQVTHEVDDTDHEITQRYEGLALAEPVDLSFLDELTGH